MDRFTMCIPSCWRQCARVTLQAGLVAVVLQSLDVWSDDVSPGLGRPLEGAELTAQPVHVFADGTGLPDGGGDTVQGESVYTSRCAACHGDEGQGGSAMELVGDRSLLATEFPDRGIAVYWPYAPALFEYIKRAMPPDKPYSLNNDEIYAVIARLLELNGLVKQGQRMDASLLSSIELPNQDNFTAEYPTTD